VRSFGVRSCDSRRSTNKQNPSKPVAITRNLRMASYTLDYNLIRTYDGRAHALSMFIRDYPPLSSLFRSPALQTVYTGCPCRFAFDSMLYTISKHFRTCLPCLLLISTSLPLAYLFRCSNTRSHARLCIRTPSHAL
jgi:hypothetical protein